MLPIEHDLEVGLAWLGGGDPKSLRIGPRVEAWHARLPKAVPSSLVPCVGKVPGAAGFDQLAGYLIAHAADMLRVLALEDAAEGIRAAYDVAFSVSRAATQEEHLDLGFLRSVEARTNHRSSRRVARERLTWPAVLFARLLVEQQRAGAALNGSTVGACVGLAVAKAMELAPDPAQRSVLGGILVERVFEVAIAPALRRSQVATDELERALKGSGGPEAA